MFALLRWFVLGKPPTLSVILVPLRCVSAPRSQEAVPRSSVLPRAVCEGTTLLAEKWFYDDLKLVSGPTRTVSVQGCSSCVELQSVGMPQSGFYSCQVLKAAGAVSGAPQLLVEGRMALFLSTITAHFTPSFFMSSAPSMLPCVLSLTMSP